MPTLPERLRKAFAESRFAAKNSGEKEDNWSEFARCVKISPQAVYQWLDGDTQPSAKNIFRAAECLGVSAHWLESGKGSMRPEGNVRKLDTHRKTPIISWDMAAHWQEAIDSLPGEETEWAPYVGGGNQVFALRVEGDSMVGPDRAFHPGEVIHVDPEQAPAPGDFVVARLKSGQLTFKQLMEEAGTPYLKALNPHFPAPIFDFEIIGRVVGQTLLL